jgi:DNA adenine methylase
MIDRPLVRYHGGKFLLADWIISNFPPHRQYWEVFGGGASVLLKKPRCYAEGYNDLDGEICNVFRVVRDQGEELAQLLRLTPFSRSEYELSYHQGENISDIERARRTIFRSFSGFGSAAVSGKMTGFRCASRLTGTSPAVDWMRYPDSLAAIIERLRGVVIENRDYRKILVQQDTKDTLFLLDPPYVHSTRTNDVANGSKKMYKFEMTDAEHEEMLMHAKKLQGYVIICGYPNEMYDDLLTGWRQVHRGALADGARKRTEVLYMSPNIPVHQLFL